ncbi:predicted protein [Sclerotinia sclerotiorum 1980 UF-70]|uniref:Uncharacterized protein n=1 Tax=Sclerotinia sclerotiorum (strain ATCC 18683 / 1980 / Ss-1) TaxID=665079 RepID=A7F4C8_SCLS1|nr:predicted protein [Sclerotinia sclerotiorum 1980 UF-70]EDN97599.1 predicted protein [Sclerotinia sclerotiorum 1980 UF-70]
MSYTNTPNSTQHTSQDDAPEIPTRTSENLKVNQLKKPVGELVWENRILRTVIKELEIANTEAGAEKRLTKTRISMFEKLDANYFLHLTDAQGKIKEAWMAKGTEIIRNRMDLDASGADIHRDAGRYGDNYFLVDNGPSNGRLHEGTERHNHQFEGKERISAAETKIKYEKMLEEQANTIAKIEKREMMIMLEIKSRYEKKLKEQCEIIASLEEKGKSTISEPNIEYEEKLKEQSSIIAKL